MSLLRIIAKILLIPVVVALTLLQWIGIFLNSLSRLLLGILAFIFTLTGIASVLFGLATGTEALEMIVIGFVIFMVSVIGEWFVAIIASANAGLRDFIRS